MRAWLLGLGLVALSAQAQANVRSIQLHLTPLVSFEPAFWRMRVIVTPQADQRAVRIETDSGGFGRVTELPLDGLGGPKVLWVEWKDLPGGVYLVVARVLTERSVVAEDRQQARVVPRP